MRIVLLILMAALSLTDSAAAQETRVVIHSSRPFGYFVGDLIRARVEVRSAANATLSPASLPRPGPLSVSLDLRDVTLHETRDGAVKRFDIDLVYQNFYVALDVRNIEIPSFNLIVDDQTVTVHGWSVGVAPLREIAPAQQDRAEDYLRPDGPMIFVDAQRSIRRALAFAALAMLALITVAWDRGWPPFQRRRARIFNALARRLAGQSRTAPDGGALARAFQSMHRAIDVANGASLLAEDVPGFLSRQPEFASLRSSFDRFFLASRRAFFSGHADQSDYGFAELVEFAQALARQERAR